MSYPIDELWVGERQPERSLGATHVLLHTFVGHGHAGVAHKHAVPAVPRHKAVAVPVLRGGRVVGGAPGVVQDGVCLAWVGTLLYPIDGEAVLAGRALVEPTGEGHLGLVGAGGGGGAAGAEVGGGGGRDVGEERRAGEAIAGETTFANAGN